MGGGASNGALPSVEDVRSAHFRDRYHQAYQRDEEVLVRERRHCGIHGFDSAAPYTQKLMYDKLTRSLASLDDVGATYCEDQRRCHGHAEIATEVMELGGHVRQICPLGDDASMACASVGGPMWIFNWREGAVVSTMRADSVGTQNSVMRMCVADWSHSTLASGDEQGRLSFWDLTGPSLSCEARLHEGKVTGLESEWQRQHVISTSRDTCIMIYDLQQQTVVDRGVPAPCTCGSGVPNTSLLRGEQQLRDLLFVGGLDGKLRVWSKGQSPVKRLFTLPCKASQPTQCRLLSDGSKLVVSTIPADPAFCSGAPGKGGLLLFDVRKLGDADASNAALIASYDDSSQSLENAGVTDMTVIEDNNDVIALCLTDGIVRAYDLKTQSENLVSNFDFDIIAKHDSGVKVGEPPPTPCAIAAVGQYVMTATTRPSLAVWRRTSCFDTYGHDAFIRKEPPPPMVLRSRCVAPGDHTDSDGQNEHGGALLSILAALENDRKRVAHLPN